MDDENSALMIFISSVRSTQKDRSSNSEQTRWRDGSHLLQGSLSRSLCDMAYSRYQVLCRYYLSCLKGWQGV